MSTFTSILFIFLSFFLTVITHEFGHMIVAQSLGHTVSIFSFGFGYTLYSFVFNSVEYKLSLIPMGGYVIVDNSESIAAIDRILFLAAGPCFNFLTGYLTLLSLFSFKKLRTNPSLSAFFITHSFLKFILSVILSILKCRETPSFRINNQNPVALPSDFTLSCYTYCVWSFALGFFSCIPVYPLDGGKIFAALLELCLSAHLYATISPYFQIISFAIFIIFYVIITARDVASVLWNQCRLKYIFGDKKSSNV